MEDELYSLTARELVDRYNDACAREDRIQGPWKASKRELIGRIRTLGVPTTDERAPETAEDTGESIGTTRGALGILIQEMLMTELPYTRIVEEVCHHFPGARTSSRSVASMASVLRRKGIAVPMRRTKL